MIIERRPRVANQSVRPLPKVTSPTFRLVPQTEMEWWPISRTLRQVNNSSLTQMRQIHAVAGRTTG
jgi:hypothetical protein